MSLYTTTEDLVQYVEEQSNEASDGTSPFRTTALSLINRAHKAIFAGGVELNDDGEGPTIFNFAKATYPQQLMLLPKEEGEVAAIQDSTTITFSVAPTLSLEGYHIRIGTDADVYRIVSHTANVDTATLDSAYAGETDTYEYDAFKLVYNLTGVIMLMGEFQTSGQSYNGNDRPEIVVTGKTTLNEKCPLNMAYEGMPYMAAILKLDPNSGDVTLQFNAYPEQRQRISIDYIPVPEDLDLEGSDPLLPKHHRLLLAELALYYYQVALDDDRAAIHLQNAKTMYRALVRENASFEEVANGKYGQLLPNQGCYYDSADNFVRSESGYIYWVG